jgi:hypothetical protein
LSNSSVTCPNCGSGEWYPTLNRKCVACGTYLDGPAEAKIYDPKDVKVTFNGVELTGFLDGDFIKFERDDEFVTPQINVSGSGTCTFTLLQEGQSNLLGTSPDDVLVRYWKLDVEAYFCRWERKQRRRARMARKKRRGWA